MTVLMGFLGAGETTLLNKILTQSHGKRIAVIENEFGEVGVDQELVVGADEEVFEMNNGCIRCTVRGDMVETTGTADPGPVASESPGSSVAHLAWMPDDRRLVAGCESGGAAVFDASAAKP